MFRDCATGYYNPCLARFIVCNKVKFCDETTTVVIFGLLELVTRANHTFIAFFLLQT